MNALPNTRDAILDSGARRASAPAALHVTAATRPMILAVLRTLLSELEETLAEGTQADVAALRAQLGRRLDSARARLGDTQRAVRERAEAAMADADGYIHEKPWQTIAMVGALALVAGVLLARAR